MSKLNTICVVGLGYIGLPTAVVLASRGVSVIGDGRAMISGPYVDVAGEANPPPSPPWSMIDLATGEQVSTTTWSEPWRFGIGCCDSPEGAALAGGVVFTLDDKTVEMWYPEALTTPLQRIQLTAPGA